MNNRKQTVTYNIDRQEHDYYATDPKAIDDLLKFIDLDKPIWECAAGKGHLSKQLEKYGKKVYSTDLIDRGSGYALMDFLTTNKKWDGDILTNPPFKLGLEFANKALSLVSDKNRVILFTRLLFLESNKRKKLFIDNPPKQILVYSSRIECVKDAELNDTFDHGSIACYCWIIWQKGYKGKTTLEWI